MDEWWDERYAERGDDFSTDKGGEDVGGSSGGYAYGTEPNDYLKETVITRLVDEQHHPLPTTIKGEEEEPLALAKEEKRTTKTCLLLADGEGRNGVYMAQQGYDVVSVDFSSVGMTKAQALATSRQVQIKTIVADLAEWDGMDVENQWDCIVGIYCHFPPPVRTKVLQAIPKALKPGGYFILECYTPQQLHNKTGGPPKPEFMYNQKILRDAFFDDSDKNGLEILHNQELERIVLEGKYHTGKASVVQFLGRKKGKRTHTQANSNVNV